LDRIDPDEIVEVVDLGCRRAASAPWLIDPGVDPRPLTTTRPGTNKMP
jgi:hypothetical protein